MWAGPVSFEIIYLAEFINEIRKLIFTDFLLSKTIFALSSLAYSNSSGPGAINIGYLFL